MEFRYEQLRVGEAVLEYVDEVFKITATFPDNERYGLTTQIRRAAVSVYLNTAEGSARKTKREFSRFLTIALGSLVETDAAFTIALRQKYISLEQRKEIRNITEQIWVSLCALRKSQL
ncbi:MAG: four helix bundle protein [Candidatus Uhrbacteria bacterium]|nr:four helix bundle protein [Patescibacteria group bacterium]MBU1907486.1 four helix bundle protein [Patescibacteria group bacterium]